MAAESPERYSPDQPSARRRNAGLIAARASRVVVATGAAVIGYAGALAVISEARNDGEISALAARWSLVAAMVAAGAIYFVGLARAGRAAPPRGNMWIILIVGLLARVILIPADPLYVYDYYRYLLDGAVTASGMNPFEYAPQTLLDAMNDPGPPMPENTSANPSAGGLSSAARSTGTPSGEARPVPAKLLELAREGGRNVERINHPDLSTIYPPTAQAAFALAYLIKPWSLGALRIVLLLFELATVLLLYRLLRELNRPVHYVAWYWWNPLLLRVVGHSAHMDVIVLPFVLAAILLALRGKAVGGGVFLALAAAAKIWPILLAPLLFRRARSTRQAAAAVAAFVLVSLVVWYPTYGTLLLPTSGFRAYGQTWENNDLVFRCLRSAAAFVLQWTPADPAAAHPIGRFLVGVILLTIVVRHTLRAGQNPTDLLRRCLIIVAAAFILSPTQYPWYYVWLLPLLAVRPVLPLLLYTVLLPLYYASFPHPWLVWIEHLPVLAWLAFVAVIRPVRGPGPAAAGAD